MIQRDGAGDRRSLCLMDVVPPGDGPHTGFQFPSTELSQRERWNERMARYTRSQDGGSDGFSLLVPKRFDRVHKRRLTSGVDAENEADAE